MDFTPLITVIGVSVLIYYTHFILHPLWPIKPKDDPMTDVARMIANRKEYTRINREAMDAWEDACQCRGPKEQYEYEYRQAMRQVNPGPALYALHRRDQYERERYSRVNTSLFNEWMKQKYMNKINHTAS
jgi:hypothetical protein